MINYTIVTGPDASGKSYMIDKTYKEFAENTKNNFIENGILLTLSEPFKESSFRCTDPEITEIFTETNEKRAYYREQIFSGKGNIYDNMFEDRKLNIKSIQNLYELNRHDPITILQDRSYLSTLVYQTVNDNFSEDWILEEHKELLEDYPSVIPGTIMFMNTSKATIIERLEVSDKDRLDHFFIANLHTIYDKYQQLIKNIEVDKEKYLLHKNTKIITAQ